jgi:hypothetical protein
VGRSIRSTGFPVSGWRAEEVCQQILFDAGALPLGRNTYERLVDRMNTPPKYVASRTLKSASWNTTIIQGDVTTYVAT